MKTILTTVAVYLISLICVAAPKESKSLAWNLNDVSILYALPKTSTQTTSHLLRPSESAILGQLLPFSVFNMIPTLNNGGEGQQAIYDSSLKVVSVRIDPCPNPLGPEECTPEVRLVWQPIGIDPDTNMWATQDAAVHTFYRVGKAEFSSFKQALFNLKTKNMSVGIQTTNVPLGVHPAFLNAKQKDKFAKSLNALLTNVCGERNLFKVTFLRLLTPNIWWRFGGFNKANDKWVAVGIPRLTINFQDIFNSALETAGQVNSPGKEMDAIFNILPGSYPVEDDLTTVINNGFRYNDDRDQEDFTYKISAIERFQNPHSTNPGNLDCASCHFADSSRFYINGRFPELASRRTTDAFVNPNQNIFNLTNETIVPKATRVIRAFGYFGDQPAISQRAINDSAESAHWLNTH